MINRSFFRLPGSSAGSSSSRPPSSEKPESVLAQLQEALAAEKKDAKTINSLVDQLLMSGSGEQKTKALAALSEPEQLRQLYPVDEYPKSRKWGKSPQSLSEFDERLGKLIALSTSTNAPSISEAGRQTLTRNLIAFMETHPNARRMVETENSLYRTPKPGGLMYELLMKNLHILYRENPKSAKQLIANIKEDVNAKATTIATSIDNKRAELQTNSENGGYDKGVVARKIETLETWISKTREDAEVERKGFERNEGYIPYDYIRDHYDTPANKAETMKTQAQKALTELNLLDELRETHKCLVHMTAFLDMAGKTLEKASQSATITSPSHASWRTRLKSHLPSRIGKALDTWPNPEDVEKQLAALPSVQDLPELPQYEEGLPPAYPHAPDEEKSGKKGGKKFALPE